MSKDKFVPEENTFSFPVCNNCKHHISGFRCLAFDKIPEDILSGDNNHSQIIDGQEGEFVFEPEDQD